MGAELSYFLVIVKKGQRETDKADVKMLAVALPGVRFAGTGFFFYLFPHTCYF